jgi:hypothetical protein
MTASRDGQARSGKAVTLARRVLWLAAAVAVIGVAPGEERALFLFGAVTTFWQPLQTVAGAYGAGEERTRRSRRPAMAVLVTTLGIFGGAVDLVAVAQAIVGHAGLSGLMPTAAPATAPTGR